MVRKLLNIILGTYYNITNKHKEISNPRLKICNKCSNKIYLYKIGFICKECGCVLESKTTLKDEKCPKNKW